MATWNRQALDRTARAEEAVLATDAMERLYSAVVRQQGTATETLIDKDVAIAEVRAAAAALPPAEAQKLLALTSSDPVVTEMMMVVEQRQDQEQQQDDDAEPEM